MSAARSFRRLSPCVLLLAGLAAPAARGQTVLLKDGRTLTGKAAFTKGVAELPDQPTLQAGEVATRPILMIDDELRRVYVPRTQVADVLDAAPEALVRIEPWQQPAHSAAALGSVGPALGISSWDEYGRRVYEMQTAQGRLSIVQGMTVITPRWIKVEALQGPQKLVAWDCRISTSSIPSDILAKILAKAVPQDDPLARLKVVQFYIQARRFGDAQKEMERIIQDFPAENDLQARVADLRRNAAKVWFDELTMRRGAGQHRVVQAMLEVFPVDDAAPETLVQLRQIQGEYQQENDRLASIGESLRTTAATVAQPDHRAAAAQAVEEMIRELTHNNVERLAPFVQLLSDASLSADEKTSLAITGWLLGSADANQNLPIAMSLLRIRDLITRFLREPLAAERQELLDQIKAEEAASIERVAKLVAHMKPPWHDPPMAADQDGFLELAAPGPPDGADIRYVVQLPPEYDPYRKYPTIFTLCGAYNTPEQAVNFWAGAPPEPDADGKVAPRRGHAMRHGFITVAVDWQKTHQYDYEFSGREHIAVLSVLRDASRRFSVDPDRVYLTGHDMGGDAAWDIGLSHPDLWAGVMPFVALADKYVLHYWENGRYVPLYFVAGELDGASVADNAPVWDRYLSRRGSTTGLPAFDAQVVEFQGRGHEPFQDEIITLFDWMNRRKRMATPKVFECDTLRPWDNFFWWLECGPFPENFMVHPIEWSARSPRPVEVSGKIQAQNNLWAKSPAEVTTIWLSPDMVDFSKPIRIMFNGAKLKQPEGGIRPDVAVLLEDVRTRADRQRPFWARIDSP